MSSPVMLKRMKEFDDFTKNKYEDIMSIPKNHYFSNNMDPNHIDEPSNVDSGETENIYVLYEGYDDIHGPLMVPEVDDIKNYDLYMK